MLLQAAELSDMWKFDFHGIIMLLWQQRDGHNPLIFSGRLETSLSSHLIELAQFGSLRGIAQNYSLFSFDLDTILIGLNIYINPTLTCVFCAWQTIAEWRISIELWATLNCLLGSFCCWLTYLCAIMKLRTIMYYI